MSLNRVLALSVAAVVAVAACSSTGSPVSTANGGGASSPAAVVVGASSTPNFGTVLTGPSGMTLYTHAGDSATTSACDGQCAVAWPPLETTSQPTAGAGVSGQLGTLKRSDGTDQVTYAGKPLYYWQGDTKAGDATGNGIEGFSVATVGGTAPAPKAPAPKATAPAVAPGGAYGGSGY